METTTGLNLACAVVLDDAEGRILLARENHGRHRWTLPGGRVEYGESPTAAAIRAAEEELGVIVELDYLIGLYYARHVPGGLRFRRSDTRLVFAARIVNGEPNLPPDGELMAFGWFAPDALPSLITDTAPLIVADAVAGRAGVIRELTG